ncbi:hypothetical protein N9933_02595 [bacterium]|nr:hypothetical protein [bacterium]
MTKEEICEQLNETGKTSMFTLAAFRKFWKSPSKERDLLPNPLEPFTDKSAVYLVYYAVTGKGYVGLAKGRLNHRIWKHQNLLVSETEDAKQMNKMRNDLRLNPGTEDQVYFFVLETIPDHIQGDDLTNTLRQKEVDWQSKLMTIAEGYN